MIVLFRFLRCSIIFIYIFFDKPGSIQINDQAVPAKSPMRALQVNHVQFSQSPRVVLPKKINLFYIELANGLFTL